MFRRLLDRTVEQERVVVADEGQGHDPDGGGESREVKVLPALLARLSVLQDHSLGRVVAQGEESDEHGEEEEEDENDAQRAPLCQPRYIPAKKSCG